VSHFPSGVKVLSPDVRAATVFCSSLMKEHTGRTGVRQAYLQIDFTAPVIVEPRLIASPCRRRAAINRGSTTTGAWHAMSLTRMLHLERDCLEMRIKEYSILSDAILSDALRCAFLECRRLYASCAKSELLPSAALRELKE